MSLVIKGRVVTSAQPHLIMLRSSLFIKSTPFFKFKPQRYGQIRFAASGVSGRPGSQTLEHAALNVKEEVGNSAADWAKAIAGGNYFKDSVKVAQDEPTFASDPLSSGLW